jgi:hypothetical protein
MTEATAIGALRRRGTAERGAVEHGFLASLAAIQQRQC